MAPILQPMLTVPTLVQAGLATGEMQFAGGVIQWAAGTPRGGEVVTWLRETSLQPAAPRAVAKALGPLAKILQIGGAVASFLNLGATIGFGIDTRRRLGRIETDLSSMRWSIDFGFLTVLRAVDDVRARIDALAADEERKTWATLASAAQLSWEAQQLEPGSQHRIHRLERALADATTVLEFLKLKSRSASDELVGLLCSTGGGSPARLASLTPRHVGLLNSVRSTALASDLRAGIQAATGQPSLAAEKLGRDHESLRDSVLKIGSAFLRGARPGEPTNTWLYDDLLQATHADAFPVDRIGRLANRFDPDVKNADGVIEAIRSHNQVAPIHGNSTVSAEQRPNVYAFADALDGAYEDVVRLNGKAAEFRTVDALGVTLDDYRTALTIPDDLDVGEREIVFFEKKC